MIEHYLSSNNEICYSTKPITFHQLNRALLTGILTRWLADMSMTGRDTAAEARRRPRRWWPAMLRERGYGMEREKIMEEM